VEGLAGGYNGDGLAGAKASLNLPESVVFDAAGNMYIADSFNHRIRKRTPAGIVSTFAGTGISGYSGDGGAATSAQLYFPFGVATDSSGNVYISDNGNLVIRKVDSTGKITTFAQNANFTDLLALTSDASGNLYAADDMACVVWKITPASVVSIAAGVLNTCGYNSDGITATNAQLNAPSGVALDATGNLFISDLLNNRVRMVSGGVISTVAGNGTCGFSGDGGSATAAKICGPVGVAVDAKNNLYIGDYSNARVREVTAGTITTLAGTGNIGYNGNALAATSTNIDGPAGLTVFKNILYVADDGQFRVRKIH
jgi:sugar lactone lactonase YvrE